jgi:hypothetical protein
MILDYVCHENAQQQSYTILDFRLRRERSVERFAILDCKKLTL